MGCGAAKPRFHFPPILHLDMHVHDDIGRLRLPYVLNSRLHRFSATSDPVGLSRRTGQRRGWFWRIRAHLRERASTRSFTR